MKKLIIFIAITSILAAAAFAQVSGAEKRYIRVGTLQSHFSAYGSERAWTGSYYEGLRWPAQYPYQDNSVIKRAWIACQDFTDDAGLDFSSYAVYFYLGDEGISLFPMEMKQSARFTPPSIYVDGDDLTSIFAADIDTIDANQIPDRIVTNVVNTSMGLTQTRTVLAFSQQYHDNYFIKIYTFTNTGNTDWDADIELNDTLRAVRMGWGTRYSMGREAAWAMGDGSQSYGKHSWVTKRGEDYAAHQNDAITVADPIQQWVRAGFSWLGQSKDVTWDNVGAPDLDEWGRLTSPHHTGSAVLHVDKAWDDSTDDASQPTFLGWHAGDTYPSVGYQRLEDIPGMAAVYSMLSGVPHGAGKGGNERMDEVYLQSITHRLDPYTVHGDGGGTNVMITYGPFDIPPGESVVIIEAEGINGLSRPMCEEIGARWFQAYEDPADAGPFSLPDGSTTTDKDEYKNTWVATGKDSIMLTFSRALRNFDNSFNIPEPPLPPENFSVQSGGDRIILSWLASPSESEADFGGYRLFRAIGKADTIHTEIFACGTGTDNPTLVHEFEDTTPIRGQSYYYYVVAFNDGSNNQTEMNPKGELHSGRFYTQTTQAATLKRQAGNKLEDIRVVPNPFNIRRSGTALDYLDEEDKLMFLDIPGQCTIRIFTERGDLVKTMEHTDGSGDHEWRLNTDYRQTLVSGVYLAHFETPDGQSAFRKFLVIR